MDALLVPGSGTARSGLRNTRPGVVHGYERFCMKNVPLPGALSAGSRVKCDGHLLERLQPSELRAIDSFMHRRFERLIVTVTTETGFGGQEACEALMYACPQYASEVLDTSRPWSYTECVAGGSNRSFADAPHSIRRACH